MKMRKWTFLFLGIGLLISGLGACSGDSSGDSKNSSVQDMNIQIEEGEAFDPNAKSDAGEKKK